MDAGYDYQCKIIMLGDNGVGKTTLETHLDPVFDQKFPLEFTIGISLKKQIIKQKLQTKMYKLIILLFFNCIFTIFGHKNEA